MDERIPNMGNQCMHAHSSYECFHGNGQNSGIWNEVDLELVNQDLGHWSKWNRHVLGQMDGCRPPDKCQKELGRSVSFIHLEYECFMEI